MTASASSAEESLESESESDESSDDTLIATAAGLEGTLAAVAFWGVPTAGLCSGFVLADVAAAAVGFAGVGETLGIGTATRFFAVAWGGCRIGSIVFFSDSLQSGCSRVASGLAVSGVGAAAERFPAT